MWPFSQWFVLVSAIVLAECALASTASAGWISTQNETKGTLVIQELSPGPNPHKSRGIRLLPGEVCREFSPVIATERRLQVWDPRQPSKLLFDDKVTCPPGDIVLRIVCEGGVLKVVASARPVKK